MNKNCPICERLLTKNRDPLNDENVVYNCQPSMSNHHYCEAYEGEKLAITKVRISIVSTVFLKSYILAGYSEIWSVPDQEQSKKVRLDYIINPDFSNLEKLEHKLRTYMMLS